MTNTTNETKEMGGVQAFSFGGNTKATPPTKPTEVQVYFPTANDMIEALQSAADTIAHRVAVAIVTQGYKQPLRNQIVPKKGATVGAYPLPTTWAEFMANEEKREASNGARGEALTTRREAIDSFTLFTAGLGLHADTVATLKAWLTSGQCNGLASQPEPTRQKIATLAGKWIPTLSDAEKETFTAFVGQLNEALQGQQVSADAFDI